MILPCPHCPASAPTVVRTDKLVTADGIRHQTKCWDCGMAGPLGLTAEEAEGHWNQIRRGGQGVVLEELVADAAKWRKSVEERKAFLNRPAGEGRLIEVNMPRKSGETE